MQNIIDIIKIYKKHYITIDNIARDIFKYIKYNYVGLLSFEEHSCYEKFIIEDNYIKIKYYDKDYDLYEYDYFNIPIENIDNYQEYIDEYALAKFDEKLKYQMQNEEKEKAERFALYKKLKDEFDN